MADTINTDTITIQSVVILLALITDVHHRGLDTPPCSSRRGPCESHMDQNVHNVSTNGISSLDAADFVLVWGMGIGHTFLGIYCLINLSIIQRFLYAV